MFLASFPGFFIGIVLIFIFSLGLKLLPTGGIDTPQSLVLPAVTLSFNLRPGVSLSEAAACQIAPIRPGTACVPVNAGTYRASYDTFGLGLLYAF